MIRLLKALISAILFISLFAPGVSNARFVSTDPVKPDPKTGASFNRYSYANNNPYRYFDPDGRQWDAAMTKDQKHLPDGAASTIGMMLLCGCNPDYKAPNGSGQLAPVLTPMETMGASGLARGIGATAARVRAGAAAPEVLSPETMIGNAAQNVSNSGVPGLMQFLKPAEQAAVANGSRATPAMLGQAVHRGTYQQLRAQAPGQFEYYPNGPYDFLHKPTGQAIELTTFGQAAGHADRGANLVLYSLPPYP